MPSPFLQPAVRRSSPALPSLIGLLALMVVPGPRLARAQSFALQLYSQGDPTNGEQYLLQLLNRARQDPVDEGQRMAAWLRNTLDGQAVVRGYGLDPDQVASAIAAFPAVPPLALDPDLLLAARQHATDMAVHNYLDHTGTDGSTPPSRVAATHYNGSCREENADLSATSLDTIHAGYLVDWGVPVDYAPLPGTVTIPPGKATAKIKVTALDQTVLNRPPGTITLVLKLKGVAGAQGKATVTFMP